MSENDDGWLWDINYKNNCYKKRRAPALLVGDPDHSYLWTVPTIHHAKQLSRGQSKWTISELIDNLRE
jgi:hypothetical protein